MAQPLLEYAPERSVTRERLAPALVPTVSALFGDVAFPARSHKGSPTVTSARHWQFDEERGLHDRGAVAGGLLMAILDKLSHNDPRFGADVGPYSLRRHSTILTALRPLPAHAVTAQSLSSYGTTASL